MRVSSFKRVLFLTLACAVLAAGCNSGGGSPGDSIPPPEDVAIDGSAVDAGDMGPDAETDAPAGPSAGPPCPEPDHAPIKASWPEIFVGVTGCNDSGSGTQSAPFCTFTRAFAVATKAPHVITVLDGTYRLVEVFDGSNNQIRAGTASEHFVIRAAAGATPVLLGSRELHGADFKDAGNGLFRVDVSSLPTDPRGMWTSTGKRMLHEMQMIGGTRSHADISALTKPGTWTKATAGGTGCPSANTGCHVYLRPVAGMNLGQTNFEVSQRDFIYAGGSHYMVVRGLTFKYTHSTSIFFEGADNILLEDNTFAHNANSNDNAYSVRIWNANGAIVRNNRVTDSRYWGGAVNSWGVTFMLSGDKAPNWVCNNEIWDIIGMGVGSKGGASNIHVVGNYIHDVGTGLEIPNSRCHWQGCDVQLWNGGGWTVRENRFVRCGRGVDLRAVSDHPEAMLKSLVHNNLFLDTNLGIVIPRDMQQPAPVVRNNIFTGGDSGIYFTAGGTTTWPDYWLGLGFDSDHNVFDVTSAVYARANWSGTEKGYTLDEYRTQYTAEAHSLALELEGVEPDWRLPAGSPLIGAGDPSVYDSLPVVNIGHLPVP